VTRGIASQVILAAIGVLNGCRVVGEVAGPVIDHTGTVTMQAQRSLTEVESPSLSSYPAVAEHRCPQAGARLVQAGG
jgi:hypothetical protein